MDIQNLIDEIEQLHIKKENEKIINLISSIDEKYRTNEIISLHARALNNEYEYQNSINLLNTISKEYQDNAYYNLRYAIALYGINREDLALEYFKKAQQKGLEEIDEMPNTYLPKLVSKWIERMEISGPRRKERLEFEKERRKNRNKKPSNQLIPDDIIKELWDNSKYSSENYIGKMPTDEDFEKVEKELGYRLPNSYKDLMKKHNGGLLAKNYIISPFQRDWFCGAFYIESIYGIDENKTYSLCGEMGSKFWIQEWKYPDIGIAIADGISGGHDMIFLDYSDCGPEGEPCVVHIDQEGNYSISYLADNFKDFISSLIKDDTQDNDDEE